MRKVLKKHPADRDIPALQIALEDAITSGYDHAYIGKASDVVAWAISPAAVVHADQLVKRMSNEDCAKAGTACSRGSTALVVEHGRRGQCKVAGCVGASTQTMVAAKVTAAADRHMGEDDRTLWARAVEAEFPVLVDERDLKAFNKHLGVVADGREEVGTKLCLSFAGRKGNEFGAVIAAWVVV